MAGQNSVCKIDLCKQMARKNSVCKIDLCNQLLGVPFHATNFEIPDFTNSKFCTTTNQFIDAYLDKTGN